MIVGGGGNYTMPSGVTASTRNARWRARPKDAKTYLHFDRRRSIIGLEKIANDPERVAKHPFFPLLQFKEEWVRFRGDGVGKKKTRKLRYAARADAAIYARYRAILSVCYEQHLKDLQIADVPIAYRKILAADGAGKNNIDFAKEVFDFVRRVGDCYVTVLDISSYFESLDHERIRSIWERLLDGPLPPDHDAVYRSVTRYTTVSLERVAERISLYEKCGTGNRANRRRRNIDLLRADRHLQLLSPRDFREKICGGDPALPSLLQRNNKHYGIPQGTPISDVIANFYLIDFDVEVCRWVSDRGGLYRRYSDDIIIVLPGIDDALKDNARIYAQSKISEHGDQLKIQDRKVAIGQFYRASGVTRYRHIFGSASHNGLEYLGFEFDGRVVRLKSATVSNAWRRLKRRSFGFAKRFVKRYRLKGNDWIRKNYPSKSLSAKIIKKVTIGQNNGFKSWTFIRYVRQASKKFIRFDRIFSRQTARYRRFAAKIIASDLEAALDRYGVDPPTRRNRS